MTGKELKIWLLSNNLTQQDLAEMLDVSRPTVNKWCNMSTIPVTVALALKTIEQNLKG